MEKHLSRKIDICIRACLKVGMELSVNDFGLDTLDERWICERGWIHPLATLIVVDQPDVKYEIPLLSVIEEHLEIKYGKDKKWVSGILDGISGLKKNKKLNKRAWKVGKNIRNKYKLWENCE